MVSWKRFCSHSSKTQVTDFFFVAFALVFFGTRLIVFPFHVFLKNSVRACGMACGLLSAALSQKKAHHRSSHPLPADHHTHIHTHTHTKQVPTPRKYLGYDYPGVTVLNSFLFVLICLHVYWMVRLVRAFARASSRRSVGPWRIV